MCNCWKTHHVLYFLAGAAFWEALIRLEYHFSGSLPRSHWGVIVSSANNLYFLGGALLLSGLLLILARGHRMCKCGAKDSCCNS